MSSEAHSISLVAPVVLLAAAVIAVPIFKRIGLGSVLGYLIAGLIIGPFGFAFFQDSTAILHIAELGIVMYLFVIGLEMQPSHLWSLRREIFWPWYATDYYLRAGFDWRWAVIWLYMASCFYWCGRVRLNFDCDCDAVIG